MEQQDAGRDRQPAIEGRVRLGVAPEPEQGDALAPGVERRAGIDGIGPGEALGGRLPSSQALLDAAGAAQQLRVGRRLLEPRLVRRDRRGRVVRGRTAGSRPARAGSPDASGASRRARSAASRGAGGVRRGGRAHVVDGGVRPGQLHPGLHERRVERHRLARSSRSRGGALAGRSTASPWPASSPFRNAS